MYRYTKHNKTCLINIIYIISVQIKIELSGSTKELKTLSQALKESNISLQLSHQLISLHKCIKSINKTQEEKQYVDTAKTLQEMQSLLNNPHNLLHDLEIYVAIKEEYCNLSRSCLMEASGLLHDRIYWSNDVKEGKTVTSVAIKTEYDDIQELMQGLHIMDHLENELEIFSTKLMDCIIKPIIYDHCSVYVVKEKVFTVEILEKKKMPCYKGVLYNLKLLFMFLHNHLNLIVADNEIFLRKLQPHLLEQLSRILIADCISHTIPSSNADLKNFEPVVEIINEFQDYLVAIGTYV